MIEQPDSTPSVTAQPATVTFADGSHVVSRKASFTDPFVQ